MCVPWANSIGERKVIETIPTNIWMGEWKREHIEFGPQSRMFDVVFSQPWEFVVRSSGMGSSQLNYIPEFMPPRMFSRFHNIFATPKHPKVKILRHSKLHLLAHTLSQSVNHFKATHCVCILHHVLVYMWMWTLLITIFVCRYNKESCIITKPQRQ